MIATADRVEFLGLRFDPIDMTTALDRITALSALPHFSYVVTPNVDHVVQQNRSDDPGLTAAYADAALCLCDSRILARLAKFSGRRLPVVPGSDLTRALLNSAFPARRLAVIGGDAQLHDALAGHYPQFDWQFHSPPMGVRHSPAARRAIVDFVEKAGADILFFAIGAPQSELVCAEIAAMERARGTALCVGASLEFLTGQKQRAPRWMQRAGLEWLFRLLSEPRRLWRRYLVEGPRIFAIWWRSRALNSDRVRSGSSASADARRTPDK